MPTITTFAEAQDVLRPLYENARTLYNLDNMKVLMAFLGNPQDQLKIIHIAGTSGKTSTAYYCAALLRAQGLTVGLTVSPHVDTINERLQINGGLLPEADYCAVFNEFYQLAMQSGVKPSYFEFLTALAYWEFARRGLDYVVMEVGMGGEMDATNVISRADKVCVITDIGLDHTEILGDSVDKIARYKAGIIMDHNTVFMYRQAPEIMTVVQAAADHHQAVLHAFDTSISLPLDGLPLFQQRNLGLAKQVIDAVNHRDGRSALSQDQLVVTSQLNVPARLERFKVGDKTVIVDGSHNQQKLQTLLTSIRELYPGQDIAALNAFVNGNQQRWQEGLEALFQEVQHFIFTTFHSEKDYPKSSVAIDEIVKYCDFHGVGDYEVEADPATAYQRLLERPEHILLITGSFYLLNHIRPLIKEDV